MCFKMTETDKEIPFNSVNPQTPRHFYNCTVANNNARVTSNSFQQFVPVKMSYGEKL
jgi:hypothetical protein